MPILNVEIVTRPDEQLDPGLAAELADQAGRIFDAAPGSTWVKLQPIASEHYAENLSAAGSAFPIIVSVLKAELPSRDALQQEIARLTAVIAEVCGRPQESVHIIYLPEGAGRVAFGGRLLPG